MNKILLVLAISGLMVLTLSGMAGAIGFSYTDTTTNASGSGITYTLNIPSPGANATLTVSGGNSAWSLDWVAFKLGGVTLDGSPTFWEYNMDPNVQLGPTYTWNFTIAVSGTIPAIQDWSLKAWYYDGLAGNSGNNKTDQLSVRVPEPGTLWMLGSGLLGLTAFGFAKSRRKK